jgi:hypothetical protein
MCGSLVRRLDPAAIIDQARRLVMGAGSEDPAPVAVTGRKRVTYLMPEMFSTAACEFFSASSGVIVPATAFESSMPKAFSSSGHFG